jgi:hypothetical protein
MAEENKREGLTPKFRVLFAQVFKPKAVKGDASGKLKYSVTAAFPKGCDLSGLMALAEAAAFDKWGAQAAQIVKHPKFKSPFKDQAELVDGEGTPYAGTEAGAMFVRLSSEIKPGLVDEATVDIIDQSDFFSGCWARAKVQAYAWEHETGGKGISFDLHHIQRMAVDEPLGGAGVRTKAQDDFTPVPVDNAAGGAKTAGGLFS